MTFGSVEQEALRDEYERDRRAHASKDESERNGQDEPERLRVVTIEELLGLEIPARECLLSPVLREKEVAMIHAWRGIGKTHMGLGIAFAVASGGNFLAWSAPRPRRVLYVDGEMPGQTMQERLAAIVAQSANADAFEPENLRLVCADLQETALPNLSTLAGQAAIKPFVDEAHLIIIDSISTLASYGRENEAESWMPMQSWALALRRQGKSVLLLHHDGKGGQQRGTSRREDILDVIISLRRPSDYEPRQGARFEVHFGKARGLHGKDVESFEAQLAVIGGCATWTTRPLEDAQLARAAALYRDDCKPGDVAQDLGVSRATAYRLKKLAAERGMLS
jgi:putative DNA primase/helicase